MIHLFKWKRHRNIPLICPRRQIWYLHPFAQMQWVLICCKRHRLTQIWTQLLRAMNMCTQVRISVYLHVLGRYLRKGTGLEGFVFNCCFCVLIDATGSRKVVCTDVKCAKEIIPHSLGLRCYLPISLNPIRNRVFSAATIWIPKPLMQLSRAANSWTARITKPVSFDIF